jgi:hypothetical protein
VLQQLRDQQRMERPLPARLQSATHRLEKEVAAQLAAAAAVTSGEAAVSEMVANLAALKVLSVEADGKVLEAQAELHGVQQQLAAGQTEVLALSLQQVFSMNMSPQQAEFLWKACVQQ